MKGIFFLSCFITLISAANSQAQTKIITAYRGAIHREDHNDIGFMLLQSNQNGRLSLAIQNSNEKIELKNIKRVGDSLFAEFPVFESQLHFSVIHNNLSEGYWFKGSSTGYAAQPLTIYRDQHVRFLSNGAAPTYNISGRWAVTFEKPANKGTRPAIAEFVQKGKKLTGTFLTPSGDYRYLEGIVYGDSLKLSTFDGSHAFYFLAKIENDHSIVSGIYCSGFARKENWTAIKDKNAKLPDDTSSLSLQGKDIKLNFSFPDVDGKMVSINDQRFKNKVIVIQLMGSWCSNCMDETAFVSNLYKKEKDRGVEMIGLAYEYSTNAERSKKSIQKFKQRFDIRYPVLLTGVTSGDSLRTEKTIPPLRKLDDFPTTIFIDRYGRVSKIHKGFSGPATGEHYEEEKKYFYKTIDQLLEQ